MRITKIGSDYITVNEENLYDEKLTGLSRVHLIKLDFDSPDENKVKNVISLYPLTNRFVIEKDVRTYNYILRRTSKKYYIMNTPEDSLISFFRRNNKVLINFLKLNDDERSLVLVDSIFRDVLKNTEVIMIDKATFDEKENILMEWNGNVIIR
jgi:hypothetical protein